MYNNRDDEIPSPPRRCPFVHCVHSEHFVRQSINCWLSAVAMLGAGTGFPVNIQYMNITGQAFEFSTDQTGSREENIPKLMKITDSE